MWIFLSIFLSALGVFFSWNSTLLMEYGPQALTVWTMIALSIASFAAAAYCLVLSQHLSYRRATIGARIGTFGFVTARTIDNIVSFAADNGRGIEGQIRTWRPIRIVYFIVDENRVSLEIRPSNALQKTQVIAEFPIEWICHFTYGTSSSNGLPALMSLQAHTGQRINIGFSYLGTLGPYSVSAFGITPFHRTLDTLVENARRRKADQNRGQALG